MSLNPLTCMFLPIFITIASYHCQNAYGATYTDFLITNNVPVRLYIPSVYAQSKLPLVVYYHGGAFSEGTTFASPYHDFVQALVDQSNVIALSVDYRLTGTIYDVSASYDDSWIALQYVASHSKGNGQNPTLNTMVNFREIFLSGDSAGANIAHNMAVKIASSKIRGLTIKGMALLCPYFWGLMPLSGEPIDAYGRSVENLVWTTASRSSNLDDTRINPLVDPKLGTLGTSEVLIVTGDSDPLVHRGLAYAQKLRTSGYKGNVEYHTYLGGHDFFIDGDYYNVLYRVSSFFNSA